MSEEEYFNRAINRICKDYDYNFATEFKELYMKKDKEIERLNNIITELEKDLQETFEEHKDNEDSANYWLAQYCRKELDKLKELKGSDKE